MGNYKRNRDWVQDYFFLFIPKPLNDELLSSWLARLAFSHNRKLSIFLSLFVRGEGNAIARADIDYLYDEKLFNHLALKSRLAIQDIFNMSIHFDEGQLFINNINNLYPPLQIRKLTDKRFHNGLMYCPKCLKEDKTPYFRKKWRYNFYNACPRHEVFLTDRCWRCYEKIDFSKIVHLKELCICFKCQKDLRENIPISLQENYKYGLKAVKWFEKGLKRGYFIINKQKVKSVFVFESVKYLRYLLDRKENLRLSTFPLIEEYYQICNKLNKYNSRKALSIKKEFILTSMVYFLFENYPKNLLGFSLQNNLTNRDFVHGYKDIPFWYKTMIDTLIPMQNKIGRKISESEVLGAIKYLKNKGEIVNQFNVAEVIGCSFTIHKGYVEIYKKIKNKNI